MTGQPERPPGGAQYPDPYAPVDYPAWYPADPYRITAPPGTSAKAVAALVTSLIGLSCCGLPSIAGMVLGVIAMRETKRSGQDGYGMALAGTIIGGLVTALWMVFLLMWLLGMILALSTARSS